jgi:hypothetical protein
MNSSSKCEPILFSDVARVVCESLELELSPSQLRGDICLLDLGLDSLTAAHLAISLEESLGLARFPLQDWADAEATRDGPRFTLNSLVAMCDEADLDPPADPQASSRARAVSHLRRRRVGSLVHRARRGLSALSDQAAATRGEAVRSVRTRSNRRAEPLGGRAGGATGG